MRRPFLVACCGLAGAVGLSGCQDIINGLCPNGAQGTYRVGGQVLRCANLVNTRVNVWLRQTPNPAVAGQAVTFDASRSEPSEGASITVAEWDFDEDGIYETQGVTVTHTFPAARRFNVIVRVRDSSSRSTVDRFGVPVEAEASPPPRANFVVTPNPARPRQAVTFVPTGSSGRDLTYRWDTDGDGFWDRLSFSGQPFVQETYPRAGRYRVGLEVEDEFGDSDTAPRQTLVISRRASEPGTPGDDEEYTPPSGSRSDASAARHRPRRRPLRQRFTARLQLAPVSPGRISRRRGVTRQRGARGAGKLDGRLRGSARGGNRTRGQLPVAHLLRSLLTTRGDATIDSRRRRLTRRGVALAQLMDGPGAACVRYSLVAQRGRRNSGRLSWIGGTGRAAGIVMTARFSFRMLRNGDARLNGTITVRGPRSRRRARSLPRACRSLAR